MNRYKNKKNICCNNSGLSLRASWVDFTSLRASMMPAAKKDESCEAGLLPKSTRTYMLCWDVGLKQIKLMTFNHFITTILWQWWWSSLSTWSNQSMEGKNKNVGICRVILPAAMILETAQSLSRTFFLPAHRMGVMPHVQLGNIGSLRDTRISMISRLDSYQKVLLRKYLKVLNCCFFSLLFVLLPHCSAICYHFMPQNYWPFWSCKWNLSEEVQAWHHL